MTKKLKTKSSKLKTDSAKGRDKRKWPVNIKNELKLKTLANDLKQLAAIDEQFEEHFEGMLEKYPRIKKALEETIAQRVEDAVRQRFLLPSQKDYRRVTLQQLSELTGRTRRSIYDWLKKGLRREADGSFFLPNFITWFEQYTIEKMPARILAAANPLQKMKAERLEIDLARARNQLLDRNTVIAGQIARHQNLINSLKHKAEEMALLAHGQPQAKIMELLNSFFDNVLRQQCQVPEELALPEEVEKQFRRLLKNLNTNE